MKKRPILFNGPMVRATLAGTKTQTRRVVNPQPTGFIGGPGVTMPDGSPSPLIPLDDTVPPFGREIICPYGQPGDRLWVREAHAFSVVDPEGLDWRDDPENWDVIYRADEQQPAGGWRDSDGNVIQPPWRPSIHMPRWASRITLEVTGVRVERLQDISEADAIAEGVKHSLHLPGGRFARENFAHLWWTINGEGSWEANPWVWVVEFKRLEGSAA